MRREGQGVSTRFYLESKPRINDVQFGFRKGISLNPLFQFKATTARGGTGSERRGGRRSASTHMAALMPGSRGARPGTGRLMGHAVARWISAHCLIGIRKSFSFSNLFIIYKLI
jgi:hypothetical protein